MTYTHILHTSIPDFSKLKSLGFTNSTNTQSQPDITQPPGIYTLKTDLPDSDFYAVITITQTEISASVYETSTDDRYVLFDYPWKNDSESAVFRCPNSKWYALVMHIPFNRLGLDSDEKVWCVNLKHDADDMKNVIDNKTVFPAYHMQKKYWITVLLTDAMEFEKLCELTKHSVELVK